MEFNTILYGPFPGLSNDLQKGKGVSLKLSLSSDVSAIIQGACSPNHIVLLRSDGTSVAAGSNAKQQLGVGPNFKQSDHMSEFLPVKIEDKKIKSVACGIDFTLWTTECGQLYVSGSTVNENPIPAIYDSFEKNDIKSTFCAAYFNSAAVITEKKTVIFWADFHKLEANNNDKDLVNYKEYKLPFPAKEISCGKNFVSVLCENQTLFRIDGGENGKITPILILSSSVKVNDRFVRMSSSEGYIAAIDFEKNLWLFGRMGKMIMKPDTPPLYTDSIDVFAFPESIVVINSNFAAWSIGENEFGQFADGTTKSSYQFAQAKLSFPVLTVVGNDKMQAYVPRPLTRSFTEFDQSRLIPGFNKHLANTPRLA